MPGWLSERDQGLIDGMLLRFVDEPIGLALALLGLLVAVGVGAVHALGPGHGKVLVGAYLAGSRGRPRDAVALGGVVAAMHTGSVLVLGVAFYLTQRVVGGSQLTPLLTLASAVAIVAVGSVLVARHVASLRRPGNPHLQPDVHHPHVPDSLPEGVPPLSRAGVLALASSGGLLPSPAAFLVLATSLAVGRSAYGLALVVAFSLGLAVTLTAVGLAVLWGRNALAARAARAGRRLAFVRFVPLVAAAAVTFGGVVVGTVAVLRLLDS